MIPAAALREVRIFAQNLVDKQTPEAEAVDKMVEFARQKKLLDSWFWVDDAIRKRFECENWFWIIRRVRNGCYR